MPATTRHAHDEILNLLIVGAGVYGICASATYLSLHPSHNVRVLDSDTTVGGVWSSTRHYPLFWAQTGASVSGFPDQPFKVPVDAEEYYDLVPARHLSEYLDEYVDGKVFARRGLRERFRLGTWVKDVRKVPGASADGDALWRIAAKSDEQGEEVYWAKKVIIATGLSSVPNMLDLPGRESFRGRRPLIRPHQKEETDINSHEHITIYGGSKSAAELAYAAAKDTSRHGEHRRVNWIVRASGSGPLAMIHPKSPFRKYRNLMETGTTRAMACLSSANPYLPERSWRELILYGYIVRWNTGPLGILQRDDFWDVVAKRVQVWRGDIVEVKDGCVVLHDGREVKTDVLICGTGWREEMSFLSNDEAARLGMPIPLSDEKLVAKEKERWRSLDEQAETKVLQRWPYLKQIPNFKKHPVTSMPYRLYRYTTPVHDHSIAFLGIPLVVNSYHTAPIQSLFAIACLDGAIPLPSPQAMEEDIAFVNAWSWIRYPVHGRKGNALNTEMLSFTDRLLEQLGLSSHRLPERERKTWKGWWADLVDPAFAANYGRILEEYRERYVSTGEPLHGSEWFRDGYWYMRYVAGADYLTSNHLQRH
ncbi:hypothetical protein LTR53_005026 [Teratosphaeriaceae sp. CCFEE 6253]|nr:hypothetical protein LTR53_005026 [Teratosphaeriaceae sp. CCFEE 6253]